MRRRALLSALATTAAGCSAGSKGPTTSTRSSGATETEPLPVSPTPDRGLEPSGTVSRSVDVGPFSELRVQRFDDIPLAHRIALREGEYAPRVRASLGNDGDRQWAYRVGHEPAPFPGGRAERASGGAAIGAAVTDPVASDEGCPTGEILLRSLAESEVLEPGESVRSDVQLFNVEGNDSCWPAGEYAFEQPLTVWTRDTAYEYTWRFELVIPPAETQH